MTMRFAALMLLATPLLLCNPATQASDVDQKAAADPAPAAKPKAEPAPASKGGTLPSAMVMTPDDKAVNTSSFNNDDRPMILVVWATSCSPCKRQLNTIHEAYEDWVDETGVKLIAVSMDDRRNTHKVMPYVSTKGWNYEVYLDPNQDLARGLNVTNPPHTLVLDGNNKIVWQNSGYVPGDEDELFKVVKSVAASP